MEMSQNRAYIWWGINIIITIFRSIFLASSVQQLAYIRTWMLLYRQGKFSNHRVGLLYFWPAIRRKKAQAQAHSSDRWWKQSCRSTNSSLVTNSSFYHIETVTCTNPMFSANVMKEVVQCSRQDGLNRVSMPKDGKRATPWWNKEVKDAILRQENTSTAVGVSLLVKTLEA